MFFMKFKALGDIFFVILFIVGNYTFSETRLLRIGNNKWGYPAKENYTFKEVTFKDGDDLFSKIEATNLQKSLFYQGFFPEFFYETNFVIETDYTPKFNELVYNEDLCREIKIRDAKKAFEYAEKDYKKGKHEKSYLSSINLATLYICGIGTEKNIQKALEILTADIEAVNKFYAGDGKRISIFEATVDDIANQLKRRVYVTISHYPPLFAYLYYKGIGVEKDIEKCDAILKYEYKELAWRNFYTGYLVPKDFDFAIHCLGKMKHIWASQTLADIYSGKYSSKDIDKNKASHWKKITKGRFPEFYSGLIKKYKELIEDAKKINNLLDLSFWHGVEKIKISDNFFSGEFILKNPFFDKQKAIIFFEEYKRRCSINPEELMNIRELYTHYIVPRKGIGLNFEYECVIFEDIEKFAKTHKKYLREKFNYQLQSK